MLLLGCGPTVGVTQLSGAKYPPREKSCKLEVMTTPPADRKHQELAMIDIASGQTMFDGKDLESMLPSIKEQACELGADAIVLRNVEAGGAPIFQATQGKASAVAIKFVK